MVRESCNISFNHLAYSSQLNAGRQFDKHGNLKQWWNNRTIAAFREAAQCIVDQYSGYTMQEINLNINGRMTQGENIADNGGLKQAFRVCADMSKKLKYRLRDPMLCVTMQDHATYISTF